ncbi:apolipoprotein N-acyltransferase [Frondihabitans sp. PhB188]|nr:apolipoprotein N-acyltransferase [Frondihabitans sp. PhB188]
MAVIVGAGGGALLEFAFPDKNIWILAVPGTALILLALQGRSVGGSLLVGLASGGTFFFVLIDWVATYLGPVPWFALAGFEAVIFAVGGIAITLAYRWVARVWPGTLGRTLLLPVVVAGLWTGREFVAGHYPYGGFSWGRVAESQSQSPFAPLTAWLGVSGLSFVLVGLAAFLLQLIVDRPLVRSTRLLVGLTAIVAVLAVPAWPTQSAGTSTIAAVQGNSKAGFFQKHDYGDLTNAQVLATYDGVRPSDTIDMLVWPEGASDRNPTTDPYGTYIFDTLSQAYDAPIVSGVITQRGSKDYNSSVVWNDGAVQAQYDKRHLVPFGEYVPDRPFFMALAPSLVGLLTRDLTPGTNSNVLDVGSIRAGISICFDIVDDALTRQMVDDGAKVILAQTNNADFGQTDENTQQLAIARLRAIETARPLVNVSTVGSSAVISADGATIDSIPAFRPGAMVTKITLGTGTTPAVFAGAALEQLVMFFGLASLVLARVLLRGSGYAEAERRHRVAKRARRLARAA